MAAGIIPNGLAFLGDRNEAAAANCTVTSNATFAGTAPLANLRTTSLTDAAVTTAVGTRAAPIWLRFEWSVPIYLDYAALFGTNLRQSAYCRMEAFADPTATWANAHTKVVLATTRNAAGRDRRVMPGLFDPKKLQVGASNWLRGDLEPRDFLLYPTNIHAVVRRCRIRVLIWTLWGPAYRPDNTDDAGYRIGHAWAGDGLRFTRHVGGSGEGFRSNDERIETPGGAVWVEPGIGKRVAMVERAHADKTLRDALFDLSRRAGKRNPIAWLPNERPDDCFRYGGLFRRTDDHQHRYVAARYTSANLELEEWKE